MTEATPNIPTGPGAKREPPPPDLVEAAKHDYHLMRGQLEELTRSVRAQLDVGFTDFDAVADVWRSLRVQQDRPATLLLAAIAVVQLAKMPDRCRWVSPTRTADEDDRRHVHRRGPPRFVDALTAPTGHRNAPPEPRQNQTRSQVPR